MEKKEKLKQLMSQRHTRVALCEKSFKHFFLYYFSPSITYYKLAPYHDERFRDAVDEYNLYVEWHRESAKSTILGVAFECWKICYRKARFICNLCYDKRKARSFNMIVSNSLNSKFIKNDFGTLYVRGAKASEDFNIETGIGEFVTTNGIKVKAFGMGEALRWEIFLTKDEGIVRPDHLYIDDIDNIDNTKNKRIIDEDMEFIQNEVFWWLAAYAQVFWLGNTIRVDGRNPRAREQYRNDPKWKVHQNFIFWKPWLTEWDPLWSRFVHTDQEAYEINKDIPDKKRHVISLESKQNLERSGYKQNRLGIPMQPGEKVIKLERCRKIPLTSVPYIEQWYLGIDPAFSTKTASDPIGLVLVWHIIVAWQRRRYIRRAKKLTWENKRQKNFNTEVKHIYDTFGFSRARIESNNGGETLAGWLKDNMIPVDVVSTTKDKLTNMKQFEWAFEDGQVLFVEWETEELIDQLIVFTGENWNEDDLVDGMMRGMEAEISANATKAQEDYKEILEKYKKNNWNLRSQSWYSDKF